MGKLKTITEYIFPEPAPKPRKVPTPGEVLLERIQNAELSAREFYYAVKLPSNYLNRVLEGSAEITIKAAIAFAKVFGTSPQFWLNLQQVYNRSLLLEKSMRTEIVVIIDKSGSMYNLVDETIAGFNSFIEDQKKIEGEARLTLVLFNTSFTTLYQNTPLNMVKPLNRETYVAGGYTALLDCVGKTINDLGSRLRETSMFQRPDNVIVTIITDGQENSSTKFTQQQIKDMIEHQQSKYSWKFYYLGANVDAFAEANRLGIAQFNTANYSHTKVGARAAFANVSSTYATLRSNGVVSASLNDTQAILENDLKSKDESA